MCRMTGKCGWIYGRRICVKLKLYIINVLDARNIFWQHISYIAILLYKN